VFVPAVSQRPIRLGRRARLAVEASALAAVIAILATARAARIEPEVAQPAAAVAAPDLEPREIDPLWTVADPIERVGYRHGRRQTFEVVPLGPTAVEVEVSTAQAFLAMRAAALDAGVELRLESGFRTVQEQRELYRAWRKGHGHTAARPGRSNHQSGRALDIAVLSAPGALPWLEEHGASFGFKRTVKSEPWHWEYVDVPIARGARHVSRKSGKLAKSVRHVRRPARHRRSAGRAHGAAGSRVASSRR
jgi:hypothetical protein